MKVKISIVLPTYNEKENLEILIPHIEKIIKRENYCGEIIVVDDNSPDGTADIAKNFNKKYKNIKVISRMKKEGIGAALREGYNNATNDYILSMDSDLSFNPEEIVRFVDGMNSGIDLIVGNRHHLGGIYEKKQASTKIKGFVSKFGNVLVRIISGLNIHDFSANFRCIRKKTWQSIKTHEKTNALLLEMIIKSKNKGFKVNEIPVTFKERKFGKSKLNLTKEAPKFFLKLISFVIKYRLFKLK
ncbi:MAG: glycosyltransferase [Nanoarchaeota archaeon]|nr:glycosyltransferase [Nanoarchaeota archaeon]